MFQLVDRADTKTEVYFIELYVLDPRWLAVNAEHECAFLVKASLTEASTLNYKQTCIKCACFGKSSMVWQGKLHDGIWYRHVRAAQALATH